MSRSTFEVNCSLSSRATVQIAFVMLSSAGYRDVAADRTARYVTQPARTGQRETISTALSRPTTLPSTSVQAIAAIPPGRSLIECVTPLILANERSAETETRNTRAYLQVNPSETLQKLFES